MASLSHCKTVEAAIAFLDANFPTAIGVTFEGPEFTEDLSRYAPNALGLSLRQNIHVKNPAITSLHVTSGLADNLEVAWKNNSTLQDIALNKISLDPGVALRLSETLPTITNWKGFTLDSASVTSEEAGHLLHAIAKSSVEELVVSFISFGNMATSALGQVLMKNVQLKTLQFWYCTLKASFLKRFSRIGFLAPQLKYLILGIAS